MWASWSLHWSTCLGKTVGGRAAVDIRNKSFLQVIRSEIVEQLRSAPTLFLGHLTGSPWIVLKTFLWVLSSISNSVLGGHQVSAPYSSLGWTKVVYSHKAVIGWRHPNLVTAWLRAKQDHPKLMCCKVLLTVERIVDLRIPKCKYSLRTSNFSPLNVQEMEGGVLEPNRSTFDL